MPTMEENAETPADRAKAIRAFYESHPYPAPVATLEQRLDRYRDPQRRRAQSLLLWPLEKPRPDRSILVAGCGTSQAARHALMEPDARVTAIDVSETSLRHTRDLQQKHDIRNLQLHRLAIERIGELGETFDQIVCTGVLHHLSDPDAGLRALRDVLARDGAMQIMVYAPYGRAGITMMQDYCRLLGIGVGDEDLRDLGQTVQALPSRPSDRRRRETGEGLCAARRARRRVAEPAGSRLFRAADLRLARAMRPQVRALVRAGGLPSAVRGDRGRAASALALQRFPRPPNMRRSSFCAGRWTGTASSPTATIANAKPSRSHSSGDAWRSFVPVRLPWTLTVKDRAPRGVAAVLINPRHTYPDLALFIDAAQERLLTAIDGERSVAEILRWRERNRQRRAGPPVFHATLGARSHRVRRETALARQAADQARATRTTQRKPTWLVDVSIGSACRAAGR